ncbi:hypothetical protein ACFPZ0_11725 [Streptomonospora nanhaiensis]|uniref:Uncharacterized protein n=1 Tax=Streptomonospora nanhaiensis TaxID=1323731 RepID=A0A853BMV7_9ACTN|nr:hypothetical protein [Streptomonospora nanhaiensis]MBV2365913.1 hypothetical protein [Streptomonospora nanhaiensis]MBX9389000.1 hypothetical protein [Streptomonospora nanhaiensis]NYI95802.1 hypothetical protein [Streptomonospora nanhaiensis]
MPSPPAALAVAVFVLGAAAFSLGYCAVTVTWRQRAPLLWAVLPPAAGIGGGVAQGEPAHMILFSLGGALAMLSLTLFASRRGLRELNRRSAAGERIGAKEYEPAPWAVWTTVAGVTAWACLSFVLFSG